MLTDIDKEVATCRLCDGLVEHFDQPTTVSVGKTTDIVIVGEAPANNGWRKSGVAWYDENHKLIPSGKVLAKLLSGIGMELEDTSFVEAVKCYPLSRNSLPVCTRNCHTYLMRQLAILNPKVVLPLGESAARAFGLYFHRFREVAGQVFDVDGYAVIPVYHPSPASPIGYSGNVPIFEFIKAYMHAVR